MQNNPRQSFFTPVISFLLVAIFTLSCQQKSSSNNEQSMLLPDASGDLGDIMVVMADAKWKGAIGEYLRNTLAAPIPGLPQEEPTFKLRKIKPIKMPNLLRMAKTMIYVTILDDASPEGLYLRAHMTNESGKKIRNDSSLYIFIEKNVKANGQEIIYLFGTDEATLLKNLKKNEGKLVEHLRALAKRRLVAKLYAAKEKKGLEKSLLAEKNFSLRIPNGYQLADKKDNFVWIRKLGVVDKSIFIYFEDYVSQEVFEQDSILALREKITTTYLRDVEEPDLYITYQDMLPIRSENITLNGKFAVKSYGLWRISDNTLGGPYRSYAFVDEKLNRLYYMEGYISAPGKDKREAIWELDAIMSTFRTSSEL